MMKPSWPTRVGWAGAFVVASLAVSALLFSVVRYDAAAVTPADANTAVFALGSEPAGLNRDISSSNSDGLVACLVYQGLVDVRSDGTIIPLLAKSWTVTPDGLVYSFALRTATWSDGQPFRADDVKYTLLQVSSRYSSTFAGSAHVISRIDTPDASTVVITLKRPYGPFLLSLGCSQGAGILPAHIWRGTNVLMNRANRFPVGTGAFMLQSWSPGQQIRLVRNPHYWEAGKPKLQSVIAAIIPQGGARTQSLLAGEVDFVTFTLLPPNDDSLLKRDAAVRLIPAPIPSIDVLSLNLGQPQLADRRVRQALMMATDRSFLLRTAYHDQGDVGTMPFTDRIAWAASSSIDYRKMYPYDLARSASLLDAAGYRPGPNGIRMRLDLNYFSEDQDAALAATAIRQMWHQVGVDVTIRPGERASLVTKIFVKRDFDLALLAYNSNGDPALGLSRMFQTSTIGEIFGNASGYSNPQVDQLLEEGEGKLGHAARHVPYAAAQEILAEDLPTLTLHERVLYSALSAKLSGLQQEYYLPTWRDASLSP